MTVAMPPLGVYSKAINNGLGGHNGKTLDCSALPEWLVELWR